jgi:hypothetical protein
MERGKYKTNKKEEEKEGVKKKKGPPKKREFLKSSGSNSDIKPWFTTGIHKARKCMLCLIKAV